MRKLAPARVSHWDDFLISYRVYMMTGSFHSGAPAARRAAKRSPIVITGKKRKPIKDFLIRCS